MRAGPTLLLACAFACTYTCACGPSAEKREAQRMLEEIGRMRDAPRQQRGPFITALEKQQPKGAAAEQARASCTAAYRALQDGHAKLDAAKRQLDAAASPRDVPEDGVEAALKLLDEAEGQLPGCSQAVAALRRIAK